MSVMDKTALVLSVILILFALEIVFLFPLTHRGYYYVYSLKDEDMQSLYLQNASEILEENGYRIDVAVPGLSKKDFNIDLENDVLTISSEQKENKNEKKHNYMRREFSYTSFKRSFQLPETIDQENIKASHDAGILTIQLPKKEEVVQKAPKTIEIK